MKLVHVLLLRQFRVIFIEMIFWVVALCNTWGGVLKVEGFEVLTMISVAGKGADKILPFLIRVLLT